MPSTIESGSQAFLPQEPIGQPKGASLGKPDIQRHAYKIINEKLLPLFDRVVGKAISAAREQDVSKKDIVYLAKSGTLKETLERKVLFEDGEKSLVDISNESGFTLQKLSKMEEAEIRDLFTAELMIDGKSMSFEEISKQTGLSIKELNSMKKNGEIIGENPIVKFPQGSDSLAAIKAAGFSTLDLLKLKKAQMLTQSLIDEAIELKNAASKMRTAQTRVEKAIDKSISKDIKLEPKDYQRAYKGMETLTHHEKSANVEALKTDEELYLLDVSEKTHLGKGSFGVASKVHDLADRTDIVIKTPNKGLNKNDQALIQHGAKIVAKLHGARATVPGIVSKMNVDSATFQTVSSLYGKGALKFAVTQDFTAQQAKDMIMDTLSALRHAHSMDIFHGDIKPANIFVDNENRVALADWDGAVDLTDKTDELKLSVGGLFTWSYVLANEQARLQKLSREQPQEARERLAKRDALEIGLSYIEALKGGLPTIATEDNLKDLLLNKPHVWAQLKEKGLADEQIQGIKWLIHPDLDKRKTPTEVFNALSGTSPPLPPFPKQL